MSELTPKQLAWRAIAASNTSLLAEIGGRHPSLLTDGELLHEAARRGSIDSARVLIELGAVVDAFDSWGVDRPLDLAAVSEKSELVRLLLVAGAAVDGVVTGPQTPLIRSAGKGNLAVAKLLVEAGADVDRDSLMSLSSALSVAEDPPPNTDGSHAKVAEYLRSVGATKPWDYKRPETFWDGTLGELTTLFVEGTLGVVCANPVLERASKVGRILIRRARHGWKNIFQTLFSCGLTRQGGHSEVGLVLTSRWPQHRRALEDVEFGAPGSFLAGVSERLLEGAVLQHGQVIGRDDPLVAGLPRLGAFDQWLVIDHESLVRRRAELADPMVPKLLLLIPHLEKRPLKPGTDALAKADFKASVKWDKPAASGGRNNLVVPLCYEAPWLESKWF